MRVAVMSDIHGFSLALRTVLADVARCGPFDRVVIAGDLCEGGPAPDEVLELLAGLDAAVIQGNTDRDLAQGAVHSATARYAWGKVGPAGMKYLADLPFEARIQPPGSAGPDDDLLVVHANPLDQDRHVPPDASVRELRELLGDTLAAAIAFGHLHICYTREALGKLLVDVSAVGNPKDGDLRCKWGELSWNPDERRWTAQLHKLPYPLEETVAQMRESGMPNPDNAIAKLWRASYS